MSASFAIPSRTAFSAGPLSAFLRLDELLRRAGAYGAELADALAVLAGAGLASLVYARCGLPDIGGQAVLQMALSGAVIAVSGLENGGLYPDRETEPPGCEPARIAIALVVGCLAALGLTFPDAAHHPHLWIWTAMWSAASFALMIAARRIGRDLEAGLSALDFLDSHPPAASAPAPRWLEIGAEEACRLLRLHDRSGQRLLAPDCWLVLGVLTREGVADPAAPGI